MVYAETHIKLLSKDHGLAESIQQAITDGAVARESANIVPSSTAPNYLNFDKRNYQPKKDKKTESQDLLTCYSCGHTGHQTNYFKFCNGGCHKS